MYAYIVCIHIYIYIHILCMCGCCYNSNNLRFKTSPTVDDCSAAQIIV